MIISPLSPDKVQIILRNDTSGNLGNKDGIAANIIIAVGAVTAGIGGNYLAGWNNRRADEEKRRADEEYLRKRVIGEYLTQIKYSIESFLFRFYNVMYHAGRDHMKNGTKNDEYYITSTLHLLGTIFAYHEPNFKLVCCPGSDNV